MNKVYHVIVNGKTLESRNLKILISRAVAEKRKRDRMKIAAPFTPRPDDVSQTSIYAGNYR
jgi:hypothetical protein